MSQIASINTHNVNSAIRCFCLTRPAVCACVHLYRAMNFVVVCMPNKPSYHCCRKKNKLGFKLSTIAFICLPCRVCKGFLQPRSCTFSDHVEKHQTL